MAAVEGTGGPKKISKTFDDLIEFLLIEFALCGLQGAGSADFHRVIHAFYHKSPQSLPPEGLGRRFYDIVWGWLHSHQDIRILYNNEPHDDLSLSEFEALELQDAKHKTAKDSNTQLLSPDSESSRQVAKLESTLTSRSSLADSLRVRLLAEGYSCGVNATPNPQSLLLAQAPNRRNTNPAALRLRQAASGPLTSDDQLVPPQEEALSLLVAPYASADIRELKNAGYSHHQLVGWKRGPRKVPKGVIMKDPTFDTPTGTTTAPRMYISQNRTWLAIAGHPMDLGRLPSMSYTLLSIISAHGANGILQPDLSKLSGQDKRSVPGRTDRLKQAGYIEKKPVQSHKFRTSLCVHKRFVNQDHFLNGPGDINEVFRSRTLILSNFVKMLYNLLEGPKFALQRTLRVKLGVAVGTWNSRVIRTAISRLEETGMVERKRVLKKGSTADSVIIIKLLRPPNDDDVKNLSFRRKPANQTSEDRTHDDDQDGEDLNPDIDLALNSDFEYEDEEDNGRIPPQWDPYLPTANLVYTAVQQSGAEGIDNAVLRDLTMGKFWKRPIESFITRLTDNWEQSQPLYLRHLSIIRDTAVTTEKRYTHYKYRTYDNFQEAVDNGDVLWEAVSKEASKKASGEKRGRPRKNFEEPNLNEWGFPAVNANDFHLRSGASSIADCRSVTGGRRRAPHWDNALLKEMGYNKQKVSRGKVAPPTPSKRASALKTDEKLAVSERRRMEKFAVTQARKEERNITSGPTGPLITSEQRKALGLPLKGRLALHAIQQIQAHREKTGDPSSIPDRIVEESASSIKHAALKSTGTEGVETKTSDHPISKKSSQRDTSTNTSHEKNNHTQEGQIEIRNDRRSEGIEDGTADLLHDSDQNMEQEEGGIGIGGPDDADVLQATLTSSTERSETSSTHLQSQITYQPNVDGVVQPHSKPPTTAKRRLSDMHESLPYPKKVYLSGLSPDRTANQDGDHAQNKPATVSARLRQEHMCADTGSSIANFPQPEQTEIPASTPIESTTPKAPTRGRKKVQSAEAQSRAQEIVAAFTNRLLPGVYINPFATRPIARGRPKKALMAVFKSETLKDVEWFKNNPSIIIQAPSAAQRKVPTRRKKQADIMTNPRSGHTTDITDKQLSANLDEMLEGFVSKEDNTQLVSVQPRSPSTTEIQASPTQPQTLVEPRVGSPFADTTNPTQTPQLIVADNDTLTIDEFASKAQLTEDPPSEMLDTLLKATSAVDNPSKSTKVTVNLSEIAPSQSSSHPLTEKETPNDAEAESHTTTPLSGSLAVTEGADATLSLPNYSALGYQRRPRHEFHHKRGVVLGGGSIWRLRMTIIWQIMELCGGMFPYNGEIAGPFYTLWDQQAPKVMARPDRSTLVSTIKRTINDPAGRLKKISFRLPTPGGTLVERFIILTKDTSPQDPRVIELRNNMIKSHPKKFYPEPVRHLIGSWDEQERKKRRAQLPQLEHVYLSELYPAPGKSLDDRIKSSAQKRRKQSVKQTVKISEKRLSVNTAAEKGRLKKDTSTSKGSRPRRKRLDTLAAPVQPARARIMPSRAFVETDHSEDGAADSDSNDDLPLIDRRRSQLNEGATQEARSLSITSPMPLNGAVEKVNIISTSTLSEPFFGPELVPSLEQSVITGMLNPSIHFFSKIGTFSTDFSCQGSSRFDIQSNTIKTTKELPKTKRTKRVRIMETTMGSPKKKRRIEIQPQQIKKKDKKKDKQTDPTLLERLTGLTGDPNEVWLPKRTAKKKQWAPHKPATEDRKMPASRNPVEGLSGADKFKKILCTLIVASCMSGEEGNVDWNIVTQAYSDDHRFDLQKTKDLWKWAQQNMRYQLETLTSRFQSEFLEAYENKRVASIDDPDTYDWAALVRWALRTCDYPEPPLPRSDNALRSFFIEELKTTPLDRAMFSSKKLSNLVRTQRILKYAYSAPIEEQPSASLLSDEELRARSWIRANTATPEGGYNADEAHHKFLTIGESVLKRVVADLIHEKSLRLRKIKRLLPGRNFNFPASYAPFYRRDFTPATFLDAVLFKKSIDDAFLNEDPAKRVFSMLRTAKDGEVMGLLTLLSDRKVKLVPRLPPINNSLDADGVAISVWGFGKGDYSLRGIDRSRFFWNLDIVPASTYRFGNPLLPSDLPGPVSTVTWNKLPEPPLPGKIKPDALLPIWSTINGLHVTYPWWYRVLNIVLQAMLCQPRSSVSEVHAHTSHNTVMPFEVQLTLDWLVSVNAASRFKDGTYSLNNGFWAAFGDKLFDLEEDWFGRHVRATREPDGNHSWKMRSHLQISVQHMRDRDGHYENETGPEEDVQTAPGTGEGVHKPRGRKRKPLTESQMMVLSRGRQRAAVQHGDDVEMADANAEATGSSGEQADPTYSATADAEMQDADAEGEEEEVDAEGEDDPDLDAEGEDDDDFFATQLRE
ncbi:hypothetical protein B0J11DRAFT_619202 [Dendryphion nanum]|uniref:B-block binding subunit of TFIIIC domain-containing protein n=1 Tax=Dendryphion nanum TaxID=256645 RepID=A0A9P9D6Q1_9PLEO|nr:hypothetical protein B0J11DRAFT_619202 [Dendryphion nanum]